MSVTTPVVAKASDDREQIASALYFVDADKLFFVSGKEQFRVGQLCKVGRPFKVEIDGGAHLFAEMLHQCGFPALARADHGNHRISSKCPPYVFFKSSFDVHDLVILANSTPNVGIARINISCSLTAVNGKKQQFEVLSRNFGHYRCAAVLSSEEEPLESAQRLSNFDAADAAGVFTGAEAIRLAYARRRIEAERPAIFFFRKIYYPLTERRSAKRT